jgi:hypothetical protein
VTWAECSISVLIRRQTALAVRRRSTWILECVALVTVTLSCQDWTWPGTGQALEI